MKLKLLYTVGVLAMLLAPSSALAATVTFDNVSNLYYVDNVGPTSSLDTYYFNCSVPGLLYLKDAFNPTQYGSITDESSTYGSGWYSVFFPVNGYGAGNGFILDDGFGAFNDCGSTLTFDTDPPAGPTPPGPGYIIPPDNSPVDNDNFQNIWLLSTYYLPYIASFILFLTVILSTPLNFLKTNRI